MNFVGQNVTAGATCLLMVAAISASGPARAARPADLPNYQMVAPGISRGGAPTDAGLAILKSRGVRTIIDLRISPKQVRVEKATAQRMGFRWLNIPMGKEAPTRKQVDTFLATLARAPKEPVFVHCQHGADRTGCMIGIYRVQVQRRPFAKAWAEMRRYGFKPYLSELKGAVSSRARL